MFVLSVLSPSDIASACYPSPLLVTRLSSSAQYFFRLLSYRPIGRSFASRHSYRPRTTRSIAAAPITIAVRFAPV